MRLIKSTNEQLRVEFELFIKASAEEAGLNEPSLERDSEHPDSYSDSHVRAAWSGFLNGAVRSAVESRQKKLLDSTFKSIHSDAADVRIIALQLCDVIENKNDLPLHKWALKSAYLTTKLRELLDGKS